MAARQTRASAAKAAALLGSPQRTEPSQQLSSPPELPAPITKKPVLKLDSENAKARSPIKTAPRGKPPINPASIGRKRKRAATPKTEEIDELPHGLGTSLATNIDRFKDEDTDLEDKSPPSKKRQHSISTPPKAISKAKVEAIIENAAAQTSPSKTKSPKKQSYGHTPGKSPYPDWPHPTAQECQVVHDLLTEVHGLHAPPETIPAPSLSFAGCGEVPSVLDALIRTYLSAATSGTNSSMSIKGIDKTFGKLKEGTGKGSPDYNEIRLADVSVLFEAIKSGGLAKTKSKNIKAILDMVYEENEAHRNAYKKRKESGTTDSVEREDGTITLEKSAELTCANPNVLTLDHLHALSDEEAFNTLLKFPGIGVKTSSCVMLFCMKRPSFAVDTHVFRLCKWLGWVPPNADRNKTFTHCEVMIPNELKYGLHQLFIRHGKSCGRCRAITGESSEGWSKGCVIDHLVQRTGAKKGGKDVVTKKVKKTKGKTKGKKKVDVSEEEEDDLDLEEQTGASEMGIETVNGE